MKRFVVFLLSFAATTALLGSLAHGAESIVVLSVEGVINPVVSDYVVDEIARAEKNGTHAVIIELNTPGGLLDATRSTIGAMLNSALPIIVYVAPRGARATSAGVFLTMASDVAAMANETHIGAAHPVTITGENPAQRKESPPTKQGEENTRDKEQTAPPANVMEEKMVSDAAAYIRTLATEHGRNAEWAERAVRESVSLTAEEAKKEKVIEIIADSRADLLAALDGRVVTKNKKPVTLSTKTAVVVERPMSGTRRLLHMLAHPNVAYIFLTLGIYALIYEFASPGLGLGGISGAIFLLLAFFSLQILPINTVGLVLILMGVILLAIDLFTPTHGVLTIGGLIAFAIGSFMLIDTPGPVSVPRISIGLIASTVITTGLFFTIALKKAVEARLARPRTGVEGLIGAEGVVREPCAPIGLVFVEGELWNAEAGVEIAAGEKVRVVSILGNRLRVEKAETPPAFTEKQS